MKVMILFSVQSKCCFRVLIFIGFGQFFFRVAYSCMCAVSSVFIILLLVAIENISMKKKTQRLLF